MSTKSLAQYMETGYWNDVSQPAGVVASPHHWATGKTTISYDASALGTNADNLVDAAFDRWGDILDMTFKPVRGVADITLKTGDLDNGGGVATASYPGNQPLVSSSNPQVISSAEITLDNNLIGAGTTDTAPAFATVIHEIGHTLGLGHAGPYNAGSDNLANGNNFSDARFADDSDQKTVMSYFTQAQNPNTSADQASPITPQIADIAAIKSIYGLDPSTRGFDTTYGYGASRSADFTDPRNWSGNNASFTIYDTGGEDTIDASSASSEQDIDLRPGEFSDFGDAGDVNKAGTLRGNVTIATGVDIENAVGGTGDDALTGNALDNTLFGREGDDTMRGRAGADSFRFGANFNSTLSSDTDVDDTINGGPGTDRLAFADSSSYDFRDATIRSVEEIDLGRGSGPQITLASDQLTGGGTDLSQTTFTHAHSGSLHVDMTGPKVDLSGLSFRNPSPGFQRTGPDTFATVDGTGSDEIIIGTELDDTILTRGGDDVAEAGDGDDLVKSNGDDALRGGAGYDTVDFSGASFAGASIDLSAGKIYHADWLDHVGTPTVGTPGNPAIETLSGFDSVRGSSGGNTIRGHDEANNLQGNGGADEIHPGDGWDELSGGADADTFVFEPDIGPHNKITDFQDDRDVLDLAAFGFNSFSDVANKTASVTNGIEITLATRTEEKAVPAPKLPNVPAQIKKVPVKDKVQLEGMTLSQFDADDVDLSAGSNTWLTSDPANWRDIANAFSTQTKSGTVESHLTDVHRFYNTDAGGHFYTASGSEANQVDQALQNFKPEGVGFTALEPDAGDVHPDVTDVFRFYNTDAGGHFYTASEAEADHVRNNFDKFVDEGVGFRAFDEQVEGTIPVFRFYNTDAGGHFYTASKQEADHVRDNFPALQDEGVGFYAYPENFDLQTLGVSDVDVDGVA